MYGKKTSFYVLTSLKENKKENVGDKVLFKVPNWFVGRLF
jgi:hypothetical protein